MSLTQQLQTTLASTAATFDANMALLEASIDAALQAKLSKDVTSITFTGAELDDPSTVYLKNIKKEPNLGELLAFLTKPDQVTNFLNILNRLESKGLKLDYTLYLKLLEYAGFREAADIADEAKRNPPLPESPAKWILNDDNDPTGPQLLGGRDIIGAQVKATMVASPTPSPVLPETSLASYLKSKVLETAVNEGKEKQKELEQNRQVLAEQVSTAKKELDEGTRYLKMGDAKPERTATVKAVPQSSEFSSVITSRSLSGFSNPRSTGGGSSRMGFGGGGGRGGDLGRGFVGGASGPAGRGPVREFEFVASTNIKKGFNNAAGRELLLKLQRDFRKSSDGYLNGFLSRHSEFADVLQDPSLPKGKTEKTLSAVMMSEGGAASSLQLLDNDARLTNLENLFTVLRKDVDDLKANYLKLQQKVDELDQTVQRHEAYLKPFIEAQTFLNDYSRPQAQFFRVLVAKLDQLFLAYRIAATGVLTVSAGKVGEALGYINLFALLIAVPFPWVGAAIQVATGAAVIASTKYNERLVESISKTINFSSHDQCDILNRAGLRLVDKYDNQLRYLTTEGATCLAECVVFRVIQCLSLKLFPQNPTREDLIAHIIAAAEAIRLDVKPRSIANRLAEPWGGRFTDEFILQQTARKVGDKYYMRNLALSDVSKVEKDVDFHRANDDESAMVNEWAYKTPAQLTTILGNLGDSKPTEPPKMKKCTIL